MAWGVLDVLLVMVLIMEMQCKNHTERLISRAHSKFITRRIIAKREISCNQEEYSLNGQCCKKCKPGYVKTLDCPTDTDRHCRQCEKGKEYINHFNELDKCSRCSMCDKILGFAVLKNCTPEQNTECTCAENHYCTSTPPCRHCNPCTVCESGVIEKQCTLTSDTVCGTAETGFPQWATALIITLLILGVAGAIICFKRRRKGFTNREVLRESHPSVESKRLITYADIDLSSHITDIAEQMTLKEVLKFVRSCRVPEPVIDQTLQDYINDTDERKIKLLQVWYQRQGIKGAYCTLISSLRELRMCAAADKIEEKLKAAALSHQEGGLSCSNDTEQSKTCTQENRNSDNGSAELNKIFSGHLEET
ncbi:PREDICTED: tumor necrosis factor receptor superfamily member 6 isoform X2 [Calidris pugnax]|uniref:tumor necrosis factor receptor superfamily member 6 isoform X2 n=1 Tax=Calidris pugnax TaxID=198806 RepID=UPI00071C2100|nr:PREDICTED: tumor necrosis factor receptor superfamily member 6 isoform X2 [Calidris pugnax]